jgi:hypothetical protein
MSAVGYNLRLILRWLKHLLRKILVRIIATLIVRSAMKPAC